jgi:hypothetical protein
MQRFWAMPLGIPIDSIGANDNFFNLNGDSISAMKLVAAVRMEGYKLGVSDVFANPKLSDLAHKTAPNTLKPNTAIEIYKWTCVLWILRQSVPRDHNCNQSRTAAAASSSRGVLFCWAWCAGFRG